MRRYVHGDPAIVLSSVERGRASTPSPKPTRLLLATTLPKDRCEIRDVGPLVDCHYLIGHAATVGSEELGGVLQLFLGNAAVHGEHAELDVLSNSRVNR